MSKIWVVEMWNDIRERWEPTIGARLTKEDAEEEQKLWRESNPDDRFRIKKYVRKGRP